MEEEEPKQENQDQDQDKKEELTQHEKKEIKKEKKEEEKQQHHESKAQKELKGKIIKYSITTAVIILIVFGGYYFIIKPIKEFRPYTNGLVHWHANFEVSICGVKQDFTHGYDFEHDAIGTPLLHTHNDNTIHIEGRVPKKEDIAIGHFFDNIRVSFSSTKIMDKKNGDLCPDGKPGTVKMYVNEQQNNEFRDYIPSQCTSPNIHQDCDKIEIKFE